MLLSSVQLQSYTFWIKEKIYPKSKKKKKKQMIVDNNETSFIRL